MTPANRTLVAIAVVLRNDEVLIGRRAAGVPLAGYWEFPGGKVRRGERPEDAVVRECLEETGLEIRVVEHFPSKVHHYDHATVDLRFFSCRTNDATATPLGTFQWTPVEQLDRFRFPDANASLIQYLQSASDPGEGEGSGGRSG